jgi:hypothetical protein
MLWIDALYINQRDVQEMFHQVQHMAEMYGSAKQVLIWLGEWPTSASCPHSDDYQALFMSMLRKQEPEGELSALELRMLPENENPIPHHIYQHYADIMALPWFSRVWIIQELAVAKMDPIVLIGDLSTTWSYLSETNGTIMEYMRLVPGPEDLRRAYEIAWEQLFTLERIRS